MTTTPDLGLPLIVGQQAQPEVTYSEALIRLQALLSGVIDRGVNTPPGGPTEGDGYIIGTAPTGAWAGKANKIAIFYGGSWRFVPDVDSNGSDIPIGARHEGLRAWVRDENKLYVWAETGSPPALAWGEVSGGGGGGSDSGTIYDFGFAFGDTPTAGSVIGRTRIGRDITIPASMDGSSGGVAGNPDALWVVDVQDDGASIGSISVSAAGAVTFTTAGSPPAPVNVADGSEITFVAPASSPPEASVSGGSFNINARVQ